MQLPQDSCRKVQKAGLALLLGGSVPGGPALLLGGPALLHRPRPCPLGICSTSWDTLVAHTHGQPPPLDEVPFTLAQFRQPRQSLPPPSGLRRLQAEVLAAPTSMRPVSGWKLRAGSSVVTRHWMAQPLMRMFSCRRPRSGRLLPSATWIWAWTRSTLQAAKGRRTRSVGCAPGGHSKGWGGPAWAAAPPDPGLPTLALTPRPWRGCANVPPTPAV